MGVARDCSDDGSVFVVGVSARRETHVPPVGRLAALVRQRGRFASRQVHA